MLHTCNIVHLIIQILSDYMYLATDSYQFDELEPSNDRVDSQNCVAVPNGKVCYNGNTAGSVATYTCDHESEMKHTRTCGSDGRWNGKIPACGNNNYIIIW